MATGLAEERKARMKEQSWAGLAMREGEAVARCANTMHAKYLDDDTQNMRWQRFLQNIVLKKEW